MPGPLWEATRELHHACEHHAVGAAMASGNPPREWYARWLYGLWCMHRVIDPHYPACTHRANALRADIQALDCWVPLLPSVRRYVDTLTSPDQIDGAAYVLLGAGLMGGAIIKNRMADWPTAHLDWPDRPAALAVLQDLRLREELADPARACFAALLASMDDIEACHESRE